MQMKKLPKNWKNIFHKCQRHSLKFIFNFFNFPSNHVTEILCILVFRRSTSV